MAEIKDISHDEIILIPAKSSFEDLDYPFSRYKGNFCGDNGECTTTAHIILFNCADVARIPFLVNLEIQCLEKYISENPYIEEIRFQLEFFLALKEYLIESSLQYSPSDNLIQFISEKCVPSIKKENVIFLKGVKCLTGE